MFTEIRHVFDRATLDIVSPHNPGRVISGRLISRVPGARKWRVLWTYASPDGAEAASEAEVSTRNLFSSVDSVRAARVRRGRGRGRGAGRGHGHGRGHSRGGGGGRPRNNTPLRTGIAQSGHAGTVHGQDASAAAASSPTRDDHDRRLELVDDIDSDADETTDRAEVLASAQPGPDLLSPHEQRWIDAPFIDSIPDTLSSTRARLQWPFRQELAYDHTSLDYFFLLYPREHLRQTLQLTTQFLQQAGHAALTEQEYMQFIGIMVAIAAHASYTIKQLFGKEQTCEIVQACPNFSAYMTYERYTAITTHLHFAKRPRPGDPGAGQGFWAIQPLLDAFNEHRARVVIPGRKLCVGKSMTEWRATPSIDAGIPAPCIVKVKSKSEPVGMMTRNIACAETGIMMRLEMVTCPAESKRKEFNATLPAGTGFLLRLSRPWWGSGRHIVADAGLASATAAVELASKGLHFTGLVEGAHRYFPKAYLQSRQYEARGSHHMCTTERKSVSIRAAGWNEGTPDEHGRIQPKCYVSTCGTSNPGVPHLKTRYQRYEAQAQAGGGIEQVMRAYHVPIPRPQLVSEYYDGCQAIDVHNHLARTTLALEQRKTMRYFFRYFQTFVRFVVTDTFLAFKYFRRLPDLKFSDFRNTLCASLIKNTFGMPPGTEPLRSSRRVVAAGAETMGSVPMHSIRNLKDAKYYRQKIEEAAEGHSVTPRLHCRVCHRLTVYYCATCTSNDASPAGIVAVCAPARRECFENLHRRTEPLRSSGRVVAARPETMGSVPMHSIRHLKDANYYRRKIEEAPEGESVTPRLHCRVCRRLTVYYCATCTSNDASPVGIVAVCAAARRECFENLHRRTAEEDPPPTARLRRT